MELAETRMGLMYDQRHFSFGEEPLSWDSLIELPLGMLTSGMHFRQSIDHNFHSRGLQPQPLIQTDAVHQLLQAVHGGFCCAIMPLDGGLETLTEHLRLQPIEHAQTLARLGLIMRRAAPRSALAEACFALYQNMIAPS
jgi:DNA-binding transcriptional LysR family regulator